jgi:predicted  nucleic acid-binding Zn ribbon protein
MSFRTHAADMDAMRSRALRDLIEGPDDTDETDTECPHCLGTGGEWSYPNAMSRIFHECDHPRCVDGRVPL